ncbi:glycosyltransferase family 4 protein, partial [Acinetobacter johnsonii]|uniref:glycosyltransferase family 4 protein n=1 Tax=Acinetobacter johnsonii TaxID=40214 RepID=UPI0030FC0413
NKIKFRFSRSQQRLYKALSILNSDDRAIVVGMINNVSEMLDATDLLISPFEKEHFARPIIEAFARGRTAIGSDVEGMDEIIDH